MSDDVIIRVENLGKKYRINHQQQNGRRYKALRDVLADNARGLLQKLKSGNQKSLSSISTSVCNSPVSALPSSEDFWALKEVSFEVKRGEVLGIIGRNGAGKSTLLKILSRITEPTEGRVRISGRIASLLEVGTGFHPELTGRENIFLNGAILGMKRVEIRTKFDEIVAFAEIERFLDTPVKKYSSGMYVRLAFAVAAHLEPEILIIDEVLAVGDADFQKKCLGKMEKVSKGGRTVLFVSHNMAVMSMLCSRAILLRQGGVVSQGLAGAVVREYLAAAEPSRETDLQSHAERAGIGEVRLTQLLILNKSGGSNAGIATGDDIEFLFRLSREISRPVLRFTICSAEGVALAHFNSGSSSPADVVGRNAAEFTCHVQALNASPGQYYINVALYDSHGLQDHVKNAVSFEVTARSLCRPRHLPSTWIRFGLHPAPMGVSQARGK